MLRLSCRYGSRARPTRGRLRDRHRPDPRLVGITIADPLGRGEPQLRLRDGTTIILPVSLRDWAMTMLVTHHHRADAEVPVFPCRIEFGVRDGHMYARPLSVDEHHDVP